MGEALLHLVALELMRCGKMTDVSLIEFILANKKIEDSALYDDKLLEFF